MGIDIVAKSFPFLEMVLDNIVVTTKSKEITELILNQCLMNVFVYLDLTGRNVLPRGNLYKVLFNK